ncbi:MAG: L,D-transpeptidase family protein, partial [Bacteroidota bacterium]
TDAIMLYATHLIIGKVDQSKIVKGWDVPPNILPKNDGVLLHNALKSNNLLNAINSIKPDNFMYVHLRNGLNNYREIAESGGWPTVPTGQVLKLDVSDARVLPLREYLIITGDISADFRSENDSIYDKDVEKAVKHFQFRHNLNQDGVVGKGTLVLINIPIEERIDALRINMERARWVIHHLPDDFLVVNIAGYNVRRITNDSTVYYSRVIVGKHYHETPIFKDKMIYAEINPTWTLPYSIATKETLPKLQKNPNYLTEKNMIIMDRNGKELDPSTIDFNSLTRNNFPYTVRQKAGPHNALGQVKFIFPNSYAVYLHDTPSRSLFSRETRAFSHGCIRLDKKWELLINLMDDTEVWNMTKINEILDTEKTTRVNLTSPIEILLLYWTAGADKKDMIFFNKDVYDRDASVLTELNKPYEFKQASN